VGIYILSICARFEIGLREAKSIAERQLSHYALASIEAIWGEEIPRAGGNNCNKKHRRKYSHSLHLAHYHV